MNALTGAKYNRGMIRSSAAHLASIAALLLSTVALPAFGQVQQPGNSDTHQPYPVTARGTVVDDYSGIKVADPYRWMEDPDSAQTRAWVTSEREVTAGYFADIPGRDRLRAQLTRLYNVSRYGVPVSEGGMLFYSHNTGLQNQSPIYVASEAGTAPRLLLDPNYLSKDGTVAVEDHVPSENGKLLAYGINRSGSDWQEWKVRDIATGRDLPDDLSWLKYTGIAWTADSKGFYYGRYDAPKASQLLTAPADYQQLRYHSIGTPQSSDPLVYQDLAPQHKDWDYGPWASEDGRYLVVTVSHGSDSNYKVIARDLRAKPGAASWVALTPQFDAQYSVLGNDGPLFYFWTTRNAPNGKIVAIDFRRPSPSNWKTIVPESRDAIVSYDMVANRLLLVYLHNAYSRVSVYSTNGAHLRDIALPGLGTVYGLSGERKDKIAYFDYTDYTHNYTVYKYQVAQGALSVLHSAPLSFDPSLYVSGEHFYTSKDGTQVPIIVTHRKGMKLDGTTPTILYGYGGFDIAITPAFSAMTAVWLQMGGAYAVANIRGGNEFGEKWHLAGTRERKQNVFDDFIAAAQWLIDNKYTSTPKLAINGASNGGLLVGACETQRPDLFGACVPEVGVMDMLRFNKFTAGQYWVADYGNPENSTDFKLSAPTRPTKISNLAPATRRP